MNKVGILNYELGELFVVTIKDDTLKKYGDIEECLIAESVFYNSSTCNWMELEIDDFGNFAVGQAII